MDLSILIVTYHSGAHILPCLKSIEKACGNLSYEICLIDNASDDNTVPLVQLNFPQAKVICNEKNLGFAAGINQGLKNTTAPFVLWLNPDTEILEGNFKELLDYFRNDPKTGILGPKILNPDGSTQLSCRSFPDYSTVFFNRYSLLTRLFPQNPWSKKYLHMDSPHDQIQQVDWVSGAALLHRREVLHQIGYLDERFFMYCEDVDFCKRTQKAGWATFFHPGLKLLHHIGGSSQRINRRMIFERHRSLWHYYTKHFRRNPFKDLAIAAGILVRYFFLLLKPSPKKKTDES